MLNRCTQKQILHFSPINFQLKVVPLQPFRKVGRVNDRAGLEIRYTLFGYRGFESLTFRQAQ